MNMTEDKITKLNNIETLNSSISKAKSNAITSHVNALSCLDIDKLDLSMINDFSEFIYRNISDVCKFQFLVNSL